MAVTGSVDKESEFHSIPGLFFYFPKLGQRCCSPCCGGYQRCLCRAAVWLHALKSVRIWKCSEPSRKSDCKIGIESVNIYWQARGWRCDLLRVKHALRCYLKIEKSVREKQTCGATSPPFLPAAQTAQSWVVTGSERAMHPCPTSSKTLVNTKFVNALEIVIEAFLGEPETAFLKVLLAPFFLWGTQKMGV